MLISRSSPLLAVLLTLSGAALAQEVELEGPVEHLACAEEQAGACIRATMKVVGTTVIIERTTPITTPTADLTGMLNLLTSDEDINGNKGFGGFENGSAVIIGQHVNGTVIADDVWVEVQENVLLGTLTQNRPGRGEFRVEGTKVVLLPSVSEGPSIPAGLAYYDERLPGLPLMNDYGFRIRPGTIPLGSAVSAEGYYKDGTFYAFLMEVTGGEIANAANPQVSILRAQCRVRAANEIELEVRGGTYMANGQTIRIFAPGRAANAELGLPAVPAVDYGTITSVADVGQFGLYDFDVRIAPPRDRRGNPTTGCPTQLRAQLNGGFNSKITSVDVR
ncbi:hypothetical protein [Indioceanicola profundi]|uniref:hypothetical protein n=1 Tax=Indioceanicola profundi TaxID=2220096 RepID=UPI000E6AAE18|nr:hypothetical protein [Indioceanicola profundi]